jgi:DNA-binding Lrp family transcriptional regulator
VTTSSPPRAEPASYLAAHRYDGAAIHHDRVERIVPCALQPRDVAVMHGVWRYKFLTAAQVIELWWAGCSPRAAQRRLRKLFDAGYLERFRPITRRGSFPWTYHLGHEGHRLLQHHGLIPAGQRFAARRIYDYGHVLHEIQLNAWVLAYRRALGPALISWDGETDLEPPAEARNGQLRLGNDWSAKGLREPHARLLRPDAVLEIERDDGDGTHTFLIEYDRTRRVDKNYGKFRRYDAFLNWWWHHTPLADLHDPPYVIFVCQDQHQREQFMAAADHELTGHRWHPSAPADRHEHVARSRVLFALERDVHAATLEAWRLPAFPPEHPGRMPEVRRVRLPGDEGRSVTQCE